MGGFFPLLLHGLVRKRLILKCSCELAMQGECSCVSVPCCFCLHAQLAVTPMITGTSLLLLTRCSGSVHGLASEYLSGGWVYVWQSLKAFYHYTPFPVLEEEGVVYFNGHKGKWKIRHMWGQFKALVW